MPCHTLPPSLSLAHRPLPMQSPTSAEMGPNRQTTPNSNNDVADVLTRACGSVAPHYSNNPYASSEQNVQPGLA